MTNSWTTVYFNSNRYHLLKLIKIDYGKEGENPIDSLRFYRKDEKDKGVKLLDYMVGLPIFLFEYQCSVFYCCLIFPFNWRGLKNVYLNLHAFLWVEFICMGLFIIDNGVFLIDVISNYVSPGLLH